MLNRKQKYIILLADDDYLNHLYYREILSLDCFEIIYVSNGRDAVSECKDNPNIDLVLMDMRMPEIDGLRAIKKIRSFNKELPILIQSAYLSSEDMVEIENHYLIDYIAKPIREDDFVKKVNQMIGVSCA